MGAHERRADVSSDQERCTYDLRGLRAPPARIERAICGLGIGLGLVAPSRPVMFGQIRMGGRCRQVRAVLPSAGGLIPKGYPERDTRSDARSRR
jgi:hypothetical protein